MRCGLTLFAGMHTGLGSIELNEVLAMGLCPLLQGCVCVISVVISTALLHAPSIEHTRVEPPGYFGYFVLCSHLLSVSYPRIQPEDSPAFQADATVAEAGLLPQGGMVDREM